MRCLFCKRTDTDVIETRISEEGSTIRRRRHCNYCSRRFTTYERIEELPILVIKRDGRRERFDRDKLRRGIIKAVGKTTVSSEQIEHIVSQIENEAMQRETAELSSHAIGEMVAGSLKVLDKVAYIRFASVFKRFVDVEEFEKELKTIS
jgi:transcriptional repressor NrdR